MSLGQRGLQGQLRVGLLSGVEVQGQGVARDGCLAGRYEPRDRLAVRIQRDRCGPRRAPERLLVIALETGLADDVLFRVAEAGQLRVLGFGDLALVPNDLGEELLRQVLALGRDYDLDARKDGRVLLDEPGDGRVDTVGDLDG